MEHSNDSLTVEAETVSWPFWDPEVNELRGKKRGGVLY